MGENSDTSTLSVYEVTQLIKEILEGSFPKICVEGEISNWRPASSGHLYFSLKDEKATINCVMFKWSGNKLNFSPEDGMKVRLSGKISVYEQRGTYQIVADSMEQVGEGNILQMLEMRKRKLEGEGLFDEDKKKNLPAFPKTVGVVTSPTGAAIKDILQTLKRRNPIISVIILPCVVQGNDAGKTIARQIRTADAFELCDVLIVGRGGGSLEDLLPFSEECVVRAIADCKIPVISAVGHERDIALSDYAADRRASTPTAAAELASPVLDTIIETLDKYQADFYRTMLEKIDGFKNIMRIFSAQNMESYFRYLQNSYSQRLDYATDELTHSMTNLLQQKKHQFSMAKNTLEQVNPLSILKRGFSIIQDANGYIIKQVDQVNLGQKLKIRVSDGLILGEVLDKKETV